MKALRISRDMELLISSFGAIQSIFMSFYLFFGKKRNTTNLLLTLFFLLITLRIIKSLLWVYLDFIPDWFINLGFMAHIASGPTLLLYLLYFIFPKQWNKLNYFHFIPALLLILFLFKVSEANFWYKGGYAFLLYHQITYTFISLSVLIYGYIKKRSFDSKKWVWLSLLMIGAASIQFAYFSNYILGIMPYLTGPIIYAIFIYVIAFYGILNHRVFDKKKNNSKYNNININAEEFSFYKGQIEKMLQFDKPYLNHTFTLQDLSKYISLPTYLTSHIINKGYNTNFSDLINSYRIDVAKSKLTSSFYKNIKIAEIAYECGFSSLSSFNTSFKKFTGLTPSNFRKKNI
ncbi:MAG: AraC family transcriptional regulator [Flavobacteriaceae bacterium]|nr:AraC family transcriptional regulator [Flavobacteriaceae bacterium]